MAALLLPCLPLLAEDDAGVPARKAPTRQEKAVPGPKFGKADAVIPLRAAEAGYADRSSGQLVFQVLLAEIALRRGEPGLASTAYADLSLRTRDPKVLERTVEVAGFARRLDLALEAAKLWVEVDPSSKQAQYVLASVMVMANETEELAPLLIRMLEADKGALAENLLGLNRMLSRNPDRRAAFAVIERVCRQFSGVAEAHYALAVAAAGAGAFDRARAEGRRALELRPDWDAAALLQAQLLMRVSTDDALAFMQDFVASNPKSRDARTQLARLLVSAKRIGEGREQFERVLRDYPDSVDARLAIGILALQQNDLDLAETQFKQFLSSPAAERNYAYFFLGQIAEERKKVAEALGYYAGVTGGEHFLQAKLRSARLLVDQGKGAEAREQLRAAKNASADDQVQLAIAEAGLLRDEKRFQEAFDLLEALLSKQAEQPDLLYETALLAEKLGKLDLMESRLRRLIELRPDNSQAYNALGYSLADRNQRLAEARELIEKALKLSPDDYFILDSMGWVLFRQGEFSEALGYLEKAHARRDDPEIAAHIGEVLWGMGRHDEARRVWLDAQKKYPGNESLADVIKKFLP